MRELRKAGERRGIAETEARSKRSLASGQFDGGCPLVGAPCPARAFVEDRASTMQVAAELAGRKLRGASSLYDEAAKGQGEAATRLSLLDAKVRRLGELRAEAGRLKPAHERWQALSDGAAGVDSRSAWDSAEAACRGAGERLASLRAAREAVEDARRRRDAARGEAERLERAVRAAQAAVAIFNAAQRRMAEDSLAEIEEQANASLASCEIPLSVEVRWSREGSGPAKTCAACGEPFPRSERVKACERCGAPRGQHVINGLTIEPSARSGGALDLGGIFLKFAAGGWLVADREAQWGCAMMDEPLATLDQYHRRAVASHLPAVLRDNGIEQAIVIGHDRAALDALSGRIEIESRDGWSTARVVA